MSKIPDNIANAIQQKVLSDLEPSSGTVLAKVGTSTLIGGSLCLLVCGQFGVGATTIATKLNHSLHSSGGGLLCAAFCGAVFALVPLLILRMQCSVLQFNVVVREHFYVVALWLAGFGGMLAYHGNVGAEFSYFLVWLLTAAATFKVGAMFVSKFGKSLDLPVNA